MSLSYESVATVSQVTSLLFFIALFAGVVAYALWPGNKKVFDEVQRKALELGDDRRIGGR